MDLGYRLQGPFPSLLVENFGIEYETETDVSVNLTVTIKSINRF